MTLPTAEQWQCLLPLEMANSIAGIPVWINHSHINQLHEEVALKYILPYIGLEYLSILLADCANGTLTPQQQTFIDYIRLPWSHTIMYEKWFDEATVITNGGAIILEPSATERPNWDSLKFWATKSLNMAMHTAGLLYQWLEKEEPEWLELFPKQQLGWRKNHCRRIPVLNLPSYSPVGLEAWETRPFK